MESEKSEFNVSLNHLNLLVHLEAQALDAAIGMRIQEWRHILAGMFRLVSIYMSEKQYNQLKDALFIITNKINKMNTQRFGMPTINPEIYDGLADFEVRVLRIAKEKGLISKMEEDAGSVLR